MTLTGGQATDRGIALALVAGLLSITLAACGSSPAAPVSPASAASVVSAPVRVARTTAGPVGYRMVGSGPSLVLVMGSPAPWKCGIRGSWTPWPGTTGW